jgi:predicted nuclease with TOPRIM domain
MGMLSTEDLKQIGDLMDEKLVDVLDVVNKGFSGVQEQFTVVRQDIADLKQDVSILKQDVSVLKQDVSELKQDVSVLKQDVTGIKAVMVTKDYLDEKLGQFEGRQVARDRKLEEKTDVLIDVLVENHTLTPSNFERLEQVRIFPRSAP